MVLSILCYSSYIAAQFYPSFYTLLPTAFILGMGAAPLWSAKCTYLTQVSHSEKGREEVAKSFVFKAQGLFDSHS